MQETRLLLSKYCQGCQHIEPVAESYTAYDNFNKVCMSTVEITCANADKCKQIYKHIEQNLNTKEGADNG